MIFCGVVAILSLLGKLLEGVITLVMLEWLNRLLGVAFAIMKWGLFLSLIVMFFDSLNTGLEIVPKEKIDESVLYNVLKSVAEVVFHYIKSLFSTSNPSDLSSWNA